jgi:hypothetical protein
MALLLSQAERLVFVMVEDLVVVLMKSFGVWCHVDWHIIAHVEEEFMAITRLDPEGGGDRLLQKLGDYLQV